MGNRNLNRMEWLMLQEDYNMANNKFEYCEYFDDDTDVQEFIENWKDGRRAEDFIDEHRLEDISYKVEDGEIDVMEVMTKEEAYHHLIRQLGRQYSEEIWRSLENWPKGEEK